MPATVSVLYAAKPDATFDMPYYLNTHMPLVVQHWGDKGLQSYTVADYKATGDGSPPAFLVQTTMQWTSMEAFKAASETESTKVVMGDVPKFTNVTPSVLVGETVQTK